VPGTTFVVDHFGRKIEEAAGCTSWFLTHFHADHYMGLNGRFKSGNPLPPPLSIPFSSRERGVSDHICLLLSTTFPLSPFLYSSELKQVNNAPLTPQPSSHHVLGRPGQAKLDIALVRLSVAGVAGILHHHFEGVKNEIGCVLRVGFKLCVQLR